MDNKASLKKRIINSRAFQGIPGHSRAFQGIPGHSRAFSL